MALTVDQKRTLLMILAPAITAKFPNFPRNVGDGGLARYDFALGGNEDEFKDLFLAPGDLDNNNNVHAAWEAIFAAEDFQQATLNPIINHLTGLGEAALEAPMTEATNQFPALATVMAVVTPLIPPANQEAVYRALATNARQIHQDVGVQAVLATVGIPAAANLTIADITTFTQTPERIARIQEGDGAHFRQVMAVVGQLMTAANHDAVRDAIDAAAANEGFNHQERVTAILTAAGIPATAGLTIADITTFTQNPARIAQIQEGGGAHFRQVMAVVGQLMTAANHDAVRDAIDAAAANEGFNHQERVTAILTAAGIPATAGVTVAQVQALAEEPRRMTLLSFLLKEAEIPPSKLPQAFFEALAAQDLGDRDSLNVVLKTLPPEHQFVAGTNMHIGGGGGGWNLANGLKDTLAFRDVMQEMLKNNPGKENAFWTQVEATDFAEALPTKLQINAILATLNNDAEGTRIAKIDENEGQFQTRQAMLDGIASVTPRISREDRKTIVSAFGGVGPNSKIPTANRERFLIALNDPKADIETVGGFNKILQVVDANKYRLQGESDASISPQEWRPALFAQTQRARFVAFEQYQQRPPVKKRTERIAGTSLDLGKRDGMLGEFTVGGRYFGPEIGPRKLGKFHQMLGSFDAARDDGLKGDGELFVNNTIKSMIAYEKNTDEGREKELRPFVDNNDVGDIKTRGAGPTLKASPDNLVKYEMVLDIEDAPDDQSRVTYWAKDFSEKIPAAAGRPEKTIEHKKGDFDFTDSSWDAISKTVELMAANRYDTIDVTHLPVDVNGEDKLSARARFWIIGKINHFKMIPPDYKKLFDHTRLKESEKNAQIAAIENILQKHGVRIERTQRTATPIPALPPVRQP